MILPLVILSTVLASFVDAASYTPAVGTCPANYKLVRRGDSLSAGETSYVAGKRSKVLPGAFAEFLRNVEDCKTPLPAYVKTILNGRAADLPNLGIAISGGGYRAAIYGAGVLNALDARNASSVKAGTAGLLQAATYLTGLSGGSWLATSLIDNDFPPIRELVFGNDAKGTDGWIAELEIGSPATSPALNQEYIVSLANEIAGKYAAGFPVTVSDLWTRDLSRHFLAGTTNENFFEVAPHGADSTFSDLISKPTFKSFAVPFPIILTNLLSTRQKNEDIIFGNAIPITNPVFEFTPFETGSFDPSLKAFTPTQHLGTTNTSSCVTNFDQTSWVTGASSFLFATYNVSAGAIDASPVGPLFGLLQQFFPQTNIRLDSAVLPNPFKGVSDKGFLDSSENLLNMVDGGLDGQVIPLQPLLVKARKVDVIVAVDASNDSGDGFAQGGSLVATAKHASLNPSVFPFPRIPTSTDEFISQNLVSGPSFFGCDDPKVPLVIYLPNGFTPAGQTTVTNTTTVQVVYKDDEIEAMLSQTFTMTTQGRKQDKEWPACLACAVAERGRVGLNRVARNGVCGRCFERYCWLGKAL